MGRARRSVVLRTGLGAGSFCAALVLGLVLVLVLIAAPACSSHVKLSGINGECFQATDCEPGLVCIPRSDGVRSCDSDLSGIQKTEDASVPRDAAGDGAGDAVADGPKSDAAPTDAAAQDAATTADAAAE